MPVVQLCRCGCFHRKVINFPNCVAAFKAFFRRANEPSLHINNRAAATGSHVVTKFTTTGAVWCLAYAFISRRINKLDVLARSLIRVHKCAFRYWAACAHVYISSECICGTTTVRGARRVFLPPRRRLGESRNWLANDAKLRAPGKYERKNFLVPALKPTTTIRRANEASTGQSTG